MADIPTELTQEFKPGEIAILDGEFEVTVMRQSQNRLMTTVIGSHGFFSVMTYRLSKKQFNFDAGILK